MNRARGSRRRGSRPALLTVLCAALAAPAQLAPAVAQTNPWHMPGMANPWYPPVQNPPGVAWPAPPQPRKADPQPQPQPARPMGRPTLDITLEAASAYVHQGLVVTLETVSDGNLSQIDVTLPRSEAVIFRDLGTPTARAETRNGRHRIVNLRHYHLIPLKPGRVRLDPIVVSGAYAGDGGSFEVKALRGIDIDVAPPEAHVEPWLPLHDLQLGAQLLDDDIIDEGRPLKLVIEQKAIGMVGAQLPSPESQLKAAGHQLYRDSTEFDAEIAADGRLTGKRTDRFTLVPLKPGELEVPGVSVSWWNVDKKRRERSIIPSRRLVVGRSGGDTAGTGDGSDDGSGRIALKTPLIWGGMILLAFVAGLGWRSLAERLRRWDRSLFRGRVGAAWQATASHVGSSLAHAFAPVGSFLGAARLALSPRRNYHRARTFLANSLPRPLRLWFCVRTVKLEKSPEDWASVLRFVMEKRLRISAQKPMGQLAAEIAEIHPGSDRRQLERLLRQLEAASFGRLPLADFEAWKKEFMRQISPHPWTWVRTRAGRREAAGLPALNPEIE